MDFSSSDEENCQLVFWNNWSPQVESEPYFGVNQMGGKLTGKVNFKSSKVISVNSFSESSCFGNWIPPLSFLKTDSKSPKKVIPCSSYECFQNGKETLSDKEGKRNKRNIPETLGKKENYSSTIEWKKGVNLDWGKRVSLHDVAKFNDGELIWGVVNLGIFANIKLWVNEYGNVSVLADGKISDLICSEMTYICITDPLLLRKMLCLSSAQWESLKEAVQETKATLKFNAFQDPSLMQNSHLEKLWFFICKRRHFLPPQCMLVKLCGAVKCIRKFKIISKLVVQDIRSTLGEAIL